jgi:hypothetical protein
LLNLEKKDSIYGHSQNIKANEKGNIFYQIPEKRITPEQLQNMIRNEVPALLPQNHELSRRLIEQAVHLVEESKKSINTLSSFFFMIETNWKDVDCNTARDSFYTHYHPPRTDVNYLNTISYMKPVVVEQDVNESFNYVNLLENNANGKPYFVWSNPHQDLINEFASLADKMNSAKWTKLNFHKKDTLEICFDSCNLLHNLKNISTNIFLVLVINDVEFKEQLKPGQIRFRYLPGT